MGTQAESGEATRADSPRARSDAGAGVDRAPPSRNDLPAAVPPMALALAGGASLTSWWIVGTAILVAFVGHASLIGVGQRIQPKKKQERVVMEIVKPPPPPPKPEPEPPPKPEPEPPPKPEPKPKPKKPPPEPPPPDTPPPPPPSNSEPPPDTPPEPVPVVTGISMDSVVKSGTSGMKVGVGNTTFGKYDPNADREDVKKYAGGAVGGTGKVWAPVRKSELSSDPRVKREKRVKYPRRLREEGVTGTVILRIQVTKTGKTRKAKILKGVHPVLDKLALQAIEEFEWEPAKKGGEAVDTIITFRYTFDLYD